jgi:hypothetical protein
VTSFIIGPFAYRDDIWNDSKLLEGPHLLPCSAQAGLSLIGDTDSSDIMDDLVNLENEN